MEWESVIGVAVTGAVSVCSGPGQPAPHRGPPGVLSFAASGASSVRRRIPLSAGAASTQSSFWAATTSRRPSPCSSSTRSGPSTSPPSTLANSRRLCYTHPQAPLIRKTQPNALVFWYKLLLNSGAPSRPQELLLHRPSTSDTITAVRSTASPTCRLSSLRCEARPR